MERLKIAILGSGNIGTDLLIKVLRSPLLECVLFAGRNMASHGMVKANSMGVKISDRGIKAIMENTQYFDLLFDATSAESHRYHWSLLKNLNKVTIDMTPARIGEMCIPAVNLDRCLNHQNLNMVSCGGQASIPLAHLVGTVHEEVEYIEVVSSIASRSAGPATRANIDEYIETTEEGIKKFSGCKRAKAILILNPAQPCIDMQTTVFAKVEKPDLDKLGKLVNDMVSKIQLYVPGYQLIVPPTFENKRIVMTVKVRGLGDYLPKYAGNLDIINCAAIATAEEYAKQHG